MSELHPSASQVRILSVSEQLLQEALHLPAGTEILGIEMTPELGVFHFKVASPEFSEVAKGNLIPNVRLLLTKHYAQTERIESAWAL